MISQRHLRPLGAVQLPIATVEVPRHCRFTNSWHVSCLRRTVGTASLNRGLAGPEMPSRSRCSCVTQGSQAPSASITIEQLTSHSSMERAMAIQQQAFGPIRMETDILSQKHSTLIATAPKPESQLNFRDDGQLTKKSRLKMQRMNEKKTVGGVVSQADKIAGYISFSYGRWREWVHMNPFTPVAKSGSWINPSSRKLLREFKHSAKQHFGHTFQPDDKVVMIHHLYVDARQQGKGVGTALLSHVEGLARSDGASFIYLHTNTALKKSVRFYESKGFKACSSMGELEFHGFPELPGMMEPRSDSGFRPEIIVEMLKPIGET
eukprot:gene21896-28936_t